MKIIFLETNLYIK